MWSCSDEADPACSVNAIYLVLYRNKEVKERINQPNHSPRANPALIAEDPSQGWSWYIKKLREGTAKLVYFYLYVILDIFSRYVVSWMFAPGVLSGMAKRLIGKINEEQSVEQNKLIIHSDRRPNITSKSVVLLLVNQTMTKSLLRFYVNNGDPYSESRFKNLQYQLEFPEQFGCIKSTRLNCKNFFYCCNAEHCRSEIGFFMSPQTCPLWTNTTIYQRTADSSGCCLFKTSRIVPGGGQTLRYGPFLICLDQQSGASSKRLVGTQNILVEVTHFR